MSPKATRESCVFMAGFIRAFSLLWKSLLIEVLCKNTTTEVLTCVTSYLCSRCSLVAISGRSYYCSQNPQNSLCSRLTSGQCREGKHATTQGVVRCSTGLCGQDTSANSEAANCQESAQGYTPSLRAQGGSVSHTCPPYRKPLHNWRSLCLSATTPPGCNTLYVASTCVQAVNPSLL